MKTLAERQQRLQGRLLQTAPAAHHEDVEACFREMRRLLISACDSRVLAKRKHEVFHDLRTSDPPPELKYPGAVSMYGGEKNFKREPGKRHFRRSDGAWFDFVVTARDSEQGVELIAYDFEIRFPAECGPPAFIRFDLNPPGHPNEDHGVRSHLHPGTDDYSVPSPILDPIEILDLFLLGLAPNAKARRR